MLKTLGECEPSWEHARTWGELVEVVTHVEASAAEAHEPALQDVCRLLKERLHDLEETVAEPTHQHRALLRYGSRLIRAYLEGTHRADAIDALVTVLQHPAWVNPLEDAEAKVLRGLLSAPPSAEAAAPARVAAPTATEHGGDAPPASEHAPEVGESTLASVLSAGVDDEPPASEDTGRVADADAPVSDNRADAPRESDPVDPLGEAAERDAPQGADDDTPGASGPVEAADPSAESTGGEDASTHEDELDAVSIDYTVEPDDPLDETFDGLPVHDLETDSAGADDPDGDPLEHTLNGISDGDVAASPGTPVDARAGRPAAEEDTDGPALGQRSDPWVDEEQPEPAGLEAPGQAEESLEDPYDLAEDEDDPLEGSYELPDDEDVAAELIRELRGEAQAAAGPDTEAAAPETEPGAEADPAAPCADPDAADPMQSLADEFDDPGQAEADLEALYSGHSESDTTSVERTDEYGEAIAQALAEVADPQHRSDDGHARAEDSGPDHADALDGADDEVPAATIADDSSDASPAYEACEAHAEDPDPSEAAPPDEQPADRGREPSAEAARTVDEPGEGAGTDTLSGALDGLAAEYSEMSAAPVDAAASDTTPTMPAGPPVEDTRSGQEPRATPSPEPATSEASSDTLWSGEGWSEAVREMVQLLMAELAEMNTSVAECAQIAADDEAPAEERRTAMAHAREQFQRFGGAAQVIGFDGLNRLCEHICENLSALEQSDASLRPDLAELLRTWSECARAYVSDPDDTAACATLARYACDGHWPEPVDDVDRLIETLVSPQLSLGEEEPAGRAAQACPEDVSLDIPPDVDAALLDGLLQELPTQTAEFTRSIQQVITGGDSMADVEVAQRVAHTLKGAANTVGVPGIANLTHHLEDILLALSKHETLPGRALGDTLLGAADCLEMMSEALLDQGPGPDEPLRVLQEVLDWANRIDREGIQAARADAPSAPPSSPETSETVTQPSLQLPPQASSEPLPEAETQTLARTDTAEAPSASVGGAPVLRVPASIVDEILRLVGETIILTGQVQERVGRALEQMRGMHGQFHLLQHLGHELEQLIDLRDVTLPQQRVANADFDPLELDQYNELHTCSRRLVEAATDSREMGRDIEEVLASLDDLLTEQGRLNRESQEAVLHTRMVAAQSIVPRLQRSVRQAGRVAGKSVVLECLGTDTLMDGDVLNELVDPLAHILRNGVDHGIEPEAERRAAGKEPGGRIQVEFQREGNHVVVRCSDDGRGLDWDAIRRVAERAGLIAPDQQMSEDELTRLILRPSFTTRSQTTQLSGRGIGLDAVQARISQLGGSLNLHSKAGKGCTVELRLPLTLISTHAVLVRVARYVFAVSNRGVQQIVHGSLGEEVRMGTGMSFHFEDNIYPLTTLETLLGLHEERRTEERHACPVLLVQGKAGMYAVKVDAVLDSRDLVVKSLGRFVPRLRGIAGATILGDGSVSTVVDLPELLGAPTRASARPVQVDDLEGAQKVRVGLPVALVVDDSLSARRSLTQVMSDSGFEVRTARDGLEAIHVIEGQRPDVVLVDLEMPRMNGLELTQHLRAREDTRNLPVVMITSRATEKHRKQAEAAGVTYYLTKPFAEDELLERVTASFG